MAAKRTENSVPSQFTASKDKEHITALLADKCGLLMPREGRREPPLDTHSEATSGGVGHTSGPFPPLLTKTCPPKTISAFSSKIKYIHLFKSIQKGPVSLGA